MVTCWARRDQTEITEEKFASESVHVYHVPYIGDDGHDGHHEVVYVDIVV